MIKTFFPYWALGGVIGGLFSLFIGIPLGAVLSTVPFHLLLGLLILYILDRL